MKREEERTLFCQKCQIRHPFNNAVKGEPNPDDVRSDIPLKCPECDTLMGFMGNEPGKHGGPRKAGPGKKMGRPELGDDKKKTYSFALSSEAEKNLEDMQEQTVWKEKEKGLSRSKIVDLCIRFTARHDLFKRQLETMTEEEFFERYEDNRLDGPHRSLSNIL